MIQIQHNGIKNPNWREAATWLFTCTRVGEDLNSRQPRATSAIRQSRTRTWDRRIASPTR